MRDLGALRRPVDLSVGATYVPEMYGQIQADMQRHINTQFQIDEMLGDSMKSLAKSHKQAILTELNKRQEKDKQALMLKQMADEERRLRKEERAALRERARLNTLLEKITNDLLNSATLEEYTPKLKIYDIKDA